ncbi:MAG: hypothetical protein ACHQZR_03000 [Candidatus Limnocylindrales bacterium]
MSEPNDPIVWQPSSEPSTEPAAPDVAAPGTASAPLTDVTPVSAAGPAFHARIGRGNALRAAIALVAGVAIVASVAVVVGTLPSSDATSAVGASPLASSAPHASGAPRDGLRFGGPLLGGAFGFGGFEGLGGPGLGGVTIDSIDGTSVVLKTADGWKRTITVDSSVKVTEAGKTMTLGDLKVGQAVRLGEKRNSDGTYTVTGLAIVVPSVVGTVTAKTATTITIKRFDGTSQVIDVDSGTVYRIAGATTSDLAAITLGMTIVAQGPQNSNGSLHALSVAGGKFPGTVRPFGPAHPKASGAPSPSAGTNG